MVRDGMLIGASSKSSFDCVHPSGESAVCSQTLASSRPGWRWVENTHMFYISDVSIFHQPILQENLACLTKAAEELAEGKAGITESIRLFTRWIECP